MIASLQVLSEMPPLNSKKRHGRAINSIADFLRKRLSVPNIYLEPNLSAKSRIDVLAADRAGGGDIHAVEIKVPNAFVSSSSNLQAYIRQMKEYPAHFKYLALPKNEATMKLASSSLLFAQDGIGRVGLFLVTEHPDSPPDVELSVAPERFRVASESIQKVERFIAKTLPDMEVRI